MVARLSLSNEELSLHLWLLIASSKQSSLFQLHHSKPRESSIGKSTSRTSIFSKSWPVDLLSHSSCLATLASLQTSKRRRVIVYKCQLTSTQQGPLFKETPIRTLTEWNFEILKAKKLLPSSNVFFPI